MWHDVIQLAEIQLILTIIVFIVLKKLGKIKE
jgi:hypothetical protein